MMEGFVLRLTLSVAKMLDTPLSFVTLWSIDRTGCVLLYASLFPRSGQSKKQAIKKQER